MGWIKDAAIDPNPNTNTYGLTVCRSHDPKYVIPSGQDDNITLEYNNGACPTGLTKIGWVKDANLWFPTGVRPGGKNNTFGITLCRK